MLNENVMERYLNALLNGDRTVCRSVIESALQTGVPANTVYTDVIWPIMVEIDDLYREEKKTSAQEAFATRINRTIVDQLQNKLPKRGQKFKKIVICSTASEYGELGAQMIADLFESDGWEVRFIGGSVSHDDTLSFVNGYCPDILLLYGVTPAEAPQVRTFIDTIKTINACPDMKVMLSGGIFNRAEGLWEEIGADLFASTADQAVLAATDENPSVPKRTINRRKKKAVIIEETIQMEAVN